MKYILSAIIFTLSASTYAANDSNFSVGLGLDHGGLGVRYSKNEGKNKYFGSLGLLSYVERSGAAIGYGVGWERMVSPNKHGLGLFLGSVDSKHFGEDVATYHGVSALYNYYFSGFSEKSFVIGASLYTGTTLEEEDYVSDKIVGVGIKLAYQW